MLHFLESSLLGSDDCRNFTESLLSRACSHMQKKTYCNMRLKYF